MQATFVYGETRKESLCVRCRGFLALCGRGICPIIVKANTYMDLKVKDSIAGSAPPAVFVGSYGYPKVIAGPLIPPIAGDTAAMDSEEWLGLGLDDILRYRFQLIRSKSVMDVSGARDPRGLLEKLQEMVMSDRPVDAEAAFEKRPDSRVAFSMREAPSGPSANLKSFSVIDNPSVPAAVDRVTSDTDYKAAPAVLDLFRSNIGQRQITRLFSVGLLGEKKSRRLVPTAWGITAVDDIIGKGLIEKVKCYQTIDKYQVFSAEALANNVCVLLMPSPWMFEGLELWHISAPNWHVDSDYELYGGRKDYASSLAGAYYAARLPVAEHLFSMRRQAGAIVFMEVLKDWVPLGVWRFRELAKEALSRPPVSFDTLEEALLELKKRLRSPIGPWLESSRLYRLSREQRLLSDFF